jgi:hypothetical protein
MARSRYGDPAESLIDDSGMVLWSFIKGEQLEYPITLQFITDANDGYVYEAVIMEAENVPGQTSAPMTLEPEGTTTILNVRTPNFIGTWDPDTAYNYEEVVLHANVYYKLTRGAAYISAITPAADPLWSVTSLNVIYLQFPSTIGTNWQVKPRINSPVYGFVELRVTEPNNGVFQKTWKPVRGMIELLYSPTHYTPDV